MRDLSREYTASLGSLLKEARKAKRITQTQLSTAVDAGGGSVVSHWEAGTRHPSVPQLHQIAKELALTETALQDIYYALKRETAETPIHWLLAGERPEKLIEKLDATNATVQQLRADGKPRVAVKLAGRDAETALTRLREFSWSSTHPEVIRRVSALVLQEVKAALDFLPRKDVRDGCLNVQLELLREAGKLCGDTATRFVAALAVEGATYVSGDVANSFRQTRELLDRSERIPQEYMPEVLRAAAINAGKSRKQEALLDVQERIDRMLERRADDIPNIDIGYLLEGVARAWGEFDRGRALSVAQQAWAASGFEQGSPPGSALRFVQLARTQAEIELSRPSAFSRQASGDRLNAALAVSRREQFDRYTDQLKVLAARQSGAVDKVAGPVRLRSINDPR